MSRADGHGNLVPGPKKAKTPGELIPQPHGGAISPGGGPGNVEGLRRGKEQFKAAEQAAQDGNLDLALEYIAGDLTRLTMKVTRQATRNMDGRSPEIPGKAVMDIVREFRQTLEVVNAHRQARGAVAAAEEFLAEMDSRLAEAQARMATGPQPAVAVPA